MVAGILLVHVVYDLPLLFYSFLAWRSGVQSKRDLATIPSVGCGTAGWDSHS